MAPDQEEANIFDIPYKPESECEGDVLRAELRAAREALVVKEAGDGPSRPPVVPAQMVTHPMHRGLSEDQLRDLVERLERDLRDLREGVGDLSESDSEKMANE